MSKPYRAYSNEWLEENEALLRSILLAAGHHRANLATLSAERQAGARNNLLDFAGIAGRDLAMALSVCDRLIDALGPTAQAMRDELDARQDPSSHSRLPIVG